MLPKRQTLPTPFWRSVLEQGGASRDSEAEFTLEYPATCPRCGHEVKTLKVARLLRTRVNFVSTFPAAAVSSCAPTAAPS